MSEKTCKWCRWEVATKRGLCEKCIQRKIDDNKQSNRDKRREKLKKDTA